MDALSTQVEIFSSGDSVVMMEAVMENFHTQILCSFVAMVLMIIVRTVTTSIIKAYVAPFFKVKHEEYDRFSGYVFNLMCHTLPAFWTYYVVQREGWLWGGQEEQVWIGWPEQKQQPEYVFIYFLCNGYHFDRLFSLLDPTKKRGDFVAMAIHHGLTAFLLGTSMALNYYRIGIIVLMVNDQSDLWVYLAKGFGATTGWTREVLSKICLIIMMATWFYFRIFLLAVYVIPIAELGGPVLSMVLCCYALWGLVLLNVYWFALMVRMLVQLATGGKYQDLTEEKADASKRAPSP